MHGELTKNSVYYAIYGSLGRIESARTAANEPEGTVYVSLDTEEGKSCDEIDKFVPEYQYPENLDVRSFHARADYVMLKNFVSAVKGEDADVIDVYEATDMFLPGLFAYKSALNGGIPQEIPDFRDKEVRERYRGDVACVDESIAGKDGTKVYLDDASLGIDEESNPYEIEGTEYNYDFDEDYKDFMTYTTSAATAEIKDGKLIFENNGEVKYMWNNVNPLSTFEVTMNFVLKGDMNVGLYLFATNVSPEADNINAYNVQFEKDVNGNYKVSLYRFNGKYGGCATTKNVEVSGNDCTIRVVVLNSTILVFVDGATKPLFVYEVDENLAGNVGIRSQYQASEINYLKIVTNEAQLAAGDSNNLNMLIETAKTYKEYDYTEATYSVLKTALEEAEKAVGLTQYKIDKAYENLYNALMGLERLPAGDKTQLNALIATAKGVDQSKYTADSYAALKSALKAAENLDDNATQGAIDTAYKALDDAYKALEGKPTDPDTDSSTDSGNTSDSGNKGGKKGCKGGIETSNVMLLTLGLIAVYAIVKKRKVNE